MPSAFVLIILVGILGDVHSWGRLGHSIIASLAQTQLTDTASDWVRSILPRHLNGNMSVVASWADEIFNSKSNTIDSNNWQWSRPLHYINTPDWACNYHAERDCKDGICVDSAIRNYTKRLESKLDRIQHQEALYFLIHFVGNIHQPLHTGFAGDSGGNGIDVKLFNDSRTNLHSLWDTGMINARIKRDFQSNQSLYYDHMYKQMIYNLQLATHDYDIEQWISESLYFVCEQIYFDDNYELMNSSVTNNLSQAYYIRSYPIIEQRLIQAGYRLGALINRLANTPITKTTTTATATEIPTATMTTSVTTGFANITIIIVVVFIIFLIGVAVAVIFLIRYLIKRCRK